MKICVDVCYRARGATAAGVLFREWDATLPSGEVLAFIRNVAEYIPGEFYRRELPWILALLEKIETLPDTVVIDGHVWLDESGRPGLGAFLFEALDRKVPVIGVAKPPFGKAAGSREVYRGACNPLHVTAAGIEDPAAREHIRKMSGNHRIPFLLKYTDRLSRSGQPGGI